MRWTSAGMLCDVVRRTRKEGGRSSLFSGTTRPAARAFGAFRTACSTSNRSALYFFIQSISRSIMKLAPKGAPAFGVLVSSWLISRSAISVMQMDSRTRPENIDSRFGASLEKLGPGVSFRWRHHWMASSARAKAPPARRYPRPVRKERKPRESL